MAITIEKTSGGQYSGNGAGPSGTAANGLDAIAGDVIMITCYSSRAQVTGVFDTHTVSAINADGITFNRVLSEAYQYEEASGSFPTCSANVDIFLGVATSTLTAVSFSPTMTGNDAFINDGWFVVQTIRGLDTSQILDTAPANPETETNVTLVSSTPTVDTVDILASDSILYSLLFMHSIGAQATGVEPTGFTIPGAAHFNTTAGSSSATSTKVDGILSYKLFNSAQSGLTVAAGSADDCWFAATIALRSDGAVVANTKRSFAAVLN